MGGNGDWFTTGGWSPAGLPTSASSNNINGDTVTINAAGATSARLAIGDGAGFGTLIVTPTGSLTTGLAWIGDNSTALGGAVVVEGTWTNTALLTIANGTQTGSLTVQNGGVVNVGSIVAAIRPFNSANITVTGAGSTLNVVGSNDPSFSPGIGLTLGLHPNGNQGNAATLLIKDGGTVNVTNTVNSGASTLVRLGESDNAKVQIGDGGAPGFLNASGINTGSAGGGQVVFNHSTGGAGYTFSTPIFGSGEIVHMGTGKTILTADNSGLIDGTYVDRGTLLNNGILGGDVEVLSGARLGGNGTFLGNILIYRGGIFSPANSPGTVTIDGDFTNYGILDIEFGEGSQDKVLIGGDLILGATSVLNLIRLPGPLPAVFEAPFVIDGNLIFEGGLNLVDNFGLNLGDRFSLFSVQDPNNTGSFFDVFVELDLDGDLSLGSDDAGYAGRLQNVKVTAVTPVPEPSTYGLVAAALLAGLGLRSRTKRK